MQNVDTTGLSKGHISVLHKATVTFLGMLVVLCVAHADMTLTGSEVRVRVRAITAAPILGLFISQWLRIFSKILHARYKILFIYL